MTENVLSLLALIVSVISFSLSWWVHKQSLVRERKQATLDAFNVFQCQVLDELSGYPRKEIEEIAEDPRSTDYKSVSKLLARCEHFAVGVNQEIYDKDTVRALAAEHIVVVYGKLLPLIQKKRSFGNNQNRYHDFEKLAKTMGYREENTK